MVILCFTMTHEVSGVKTPIGVMRVEMEKGWT